MIHLKPLTHHGPQTHKPHKQGYLKWHYHPNTQEQHRIKELQEQITNTNNPYSKAYLQEQLFKILAKHANHQKTTTTKSLNTIIKNLELILKNHIDRHALDIIRDKDTPQPEAIPKLIQTLIRLKHAEQERQQNPQTDHRTPQCDNNQPHTFPQELDNQLQKEYKTHIPTPTGPITHTHNPNNNTYQITDGTETITINAQQILKQAAKHTNDKNTLKHLLKTLKHIQQDLQQYGPHQGLLHPDDRPHTTKHKELKEFIQKSAETSRLNRETYMKKSQEIQGRIDKHRRRAKEYLSQLP